MNVESLGIRIQTSSALCYNYDTTTTRLAVSVWGSMFVFYFILILSILIVSIKYNVER